MKNGKVKVKTKKKGSLTPVIISIVSLSAFIMMLSVGIAPELMGDSVTSKNGYTIVFDANGGQGTMGIQKIAVGKQAPLKGNKFKLDGFEFNGWRVKRSDNKWLCYTDANKVYNEWTDMSYCNNYGYSLFGDEVYVKDIVQAGDTITLYADWIKSN